MGRRAGREKEKPSGKEHGGQIPEGQGDAGERVTIPIDVCASNHRALLYSLSTDLP